VITKLKTSRRQMVAGFTQDPGATGPPKPNTARCGIRANCKTTFKSSASMAPLVVVRRAVGRSSWIRFMFRTRPDSTTLFSPE